MIRHLTGHDLDAEAIRALTSDAASIFMDTWQIHTEDDPIERQRYVELAAATAVSLHKAVVDRVLADANEVIDKANEMQGSVVAPGAA